MAVAGAEAWWARAREELAAAKTLKATGQRLQAYHHAGQAVEFALKALYLRRKNLPELPDTCKGAKWHDLEHIADQAGLTSGVRALASDRNKQQNWLTAKDWKSNGRFPGSTPTVKELNELFLAVSQDRDGVMAWLDAIYQKS